MALASEFGVADRCRLVDAADKNVILYGSIPPTMNSRTTMKILSPGSADTRFGRSR